MNPGHVAWRATARGFTLIEMVIAIAVLALLMSLALPSFGEALARARLKSAAEELAFDLGATRLESLRPAGVPLHVSVQAGTAWCWAIGPAPQPDCRGSAPGSYKVVHSEDYPGVSMPTGASAQFDGHDALPSTTLAAEFVSTHGHSLRVHMTPLGRATICAQALPVGDYPRC